MKLGLTGFFLYALTLVSIAQTTLTSTGSGDWSTPESWDKKRIPGDKDIIVIQAGHSIELNKDLTFKNITLRVIGILSLNNGRSLNLNSGSIINVISGGRIRSQKPSDQSAIYLAGAAKFRGTKVFNSNWGAGVINGLAYATSTTGNIDLLGTGFIFGNLPAVWQDFNLFRTSDNQVQMVWVTSHETGTRIFNIERSRNAQTWDLIGEIESPGSPGSQNIYNFVDSDPGYGIVYYRVKEIDPDGLYKFSSVRSLRMDASIVEHKIFPNPARSVVQVSHMKVPDSQSKLFIYNVNGQTIRVINLSSGSSFETIDISGLQNGMYLIQIRYSDGSTQNNSLVKY
jgi:Secretion system C-terminal sorting domain/G8 domain